MAIENTQNYFYVCNGKILKSMEDMLDLLKTIDEISFNHHVNLEKNDFALWTKDILKDNTLSKKLNKTKNKKEMINAIEKRLKSKNKKNIISQIKGAIIND